MASLSNVYEDALRQYEELHLQGKLTDEQLALIKGKASIGDVLKEVDEAKTKNELARSAVMRFIHKVTPDYVSKLERFSKVVEVAIQSKPEFAALVWSGVKFVILISRDVFDTYDKVCDIVEKISLCLERFSDVVDICGVTNLLHTRLATFYSDIMEFCLETIKFFTRTKLRTIGASIWKSVSEPFEELLRKIDSHTQEIEKAAQVEHMRITRDAQISNTPHFPPSKIFKVPDLLHRHFTGRVEQLQKVRQMLDASPPGSKRFSIFGMPGVGKTQLTLKHAHENRDLYTNIFYIQATDREQLSGGYQIICGLLGLPESSTSEQDLIVEGVKRWFINNSDWLIVFDNVVHIATIREFLPASVTGSIIFTMRDRNMAKELGLSGVIELLPMEEADGVELILKVSEVSATSIDSETRRLAVELNRELGGLPLALEQGVSFSNHRDWPLEKYLDQLRTQKSNALKLDMGNQSTGPNFYSSFMLAIQGITPEAVAVLKLLSHLDHQNVPLKLFERGASGLVSFLDRLQGVSASPVTKTVNRLKKLPNQLKDPKSAIRQLRGDRSQRAAYRAIGAHKTPNNGSVVVLLRRLVSDMDELEKAISCLQASALIRRKEEGTIWMHDLVRDLSEDLIGTLEKKFFTAIAIVLAGSAFPANTDHTEWSTCETFASHITNSFRHAKLLEIGLPERISAASQFAGYYSTRHRYSDAINWYECVLSGEERVLGKDHPNTLTTVNNMAEVFSNQGEYSKALEWFERALAGRETALGKDHPDTLATVHNMALVFSNQGEYSKALEWYERALAGEEKALGKDHPNTLSTIHSMASVFSKQGEYSKALEWYERALAGEETALGKDHPNTLTTVHNMASVFSNQGEYSKALEWYERALAGEETALGKDHPNTLATVYSMALVFSNQGEYSKALEWFERALAGAEKVLGKDHPDTLTTVHSMALVFSNQGEYSKALEWYERALAEREKVLGKNHRDTLKIIDHIQELQKKQKLAEEVEAAAADNRTTVSNSPGL